MSDSEQKLDSPCIGDIVFMPDTPYYEIVVAVAESDSILTVSLTTGTEFLRQSSWATIYARASYPHVPESHYGFRQAENIGSVPSER